MTTSQESVLVVGGSSGIGLATAKAFQERGYRVTVAGRSEAKLRAAAAVIGGTATILAFDAGDAASAAAAAERIETLDHLAVTAGGGVAMGSFRELGAEAFRGAFAGKLMVQALAVETFLPKLSPKGSIGLVSGMAGRHAIPGMLTAGIANAGIEAMVRTLAKELAPLRVNGVAPGLIDTPVYAGMPAEARDGMFQATAARLPVGRVGRPEDIAAALLMLAENGFVTGAIIEADGGLHLG